MIIGKFNPVKPAPTPIKGPQIVTKPKVKKDKPQPKQDKKVS